MPAGRGPCGGREPERAEASAEPGEVEAAEPLAGPAKQEASAQEEAVSAPDAAATPAPAAGWFHRWMHRVAVPVR